MRAAAFLETELDARKAIAKTLKEALTLRGKAVHGAAHLTRDDNQLIERLGDVARKAVRDVIVDHYAKGHKLTGAYFDDLLLG